MRLDRRNVPVCLGVREALRRLESATVAVNLVHGPAVCSGGSALLRGAQDWGPGQPPLFLLRGELTSVYTDVTGTGERPVLVRLPLTWLPFPCEFSCADVGVSRTNAGDPVAALTSRPSREVFLPRN